MTALAVAAVLVAPTSSHAEPLVEPRNTGGGDTIGTISYPSPGMPPIDGACRYDMPSNVGFMSTAFVFNTVISGFAGPVTITGTGNSKRSCESYALGGGSMTLHVDGFNPITESKLDCNNNDDQLGWTGGDTGSHLTGTYTRVGSDMTVILSGHCVVNKFGTGRVMFVARAQLVPSDVQEGAGVLSPVMEASTAGYFVLAPA